MVDLDLSGLFQPLVLYETWFLLLASVLQGLFSLYLVFGAGCRSSSDQFSGVLGHFWVQCLSSVTCCHTGTFKLNQNLGFEH